MGRSFATVSDRVNCGAITLATTLSVTAWLKAPSTNADNVLLDVQDICVLNFLVGVDMTFDLDHAGTTLSGKWRCDSAVHGMTLANWNHVAWTHDSTSTANNPTLYCNGVTKALTQNVVPTQAIQAVSKTLRVGNFNSDTLSIGGSVGFVCVHNVVLSAAEVKASMDYGYSPRGLVRFYMLRGDSPEIDSTGAANGTVTGTAVVADPPVHEIQRLVRPVMAAQLASTT